jgi:CheY-like chemotaxis protein
MHPTDTQCPAVIWIGEVGSPEFSRIHFELESVIAVEVCASPIVALSRLAELPEEPLLLLFAQRYPAEFPAAAVELLRRRLPLARWLALVGSWCEGEPRSGQPLPGVTQLYWHQWTEQTLRDLRKLLAGEFGPWSLPATASEEDRLAAALASAEQHRPSAPGLVCIVAQDREAALALADVLSAANIPSVWRRADSPQAASGVAATVVDLARGDECEWRTLAETCASAEAGPVLALLGFPRPADADRAAQLGAAKLLSKPLRAADLRAEIQRAIAIRSAAT